jgi:hypothetical protein
MRLGHLMGLAALTLLILGGLPVSAAAQSSGTPVSAAAQSSGTLGTSAAINCGNFLPASEGRQQHAQAVYDADSSDPYGLDGPKGPNNDTRGEPGIACETESDLGTASPASCQDFLPATEGGREHAQALFDQAANGDPYLLDIDGNGIACDGDKGGDNDQDPLDGPPPDRRPDDQKDLDGGVPTSGGTNVVVSVTPLHDFDDLEARLDARFAALETQFAAFVVRAENGFGRFEESADDALVQRRSASVELTSHLTAGMTRRAERVDAGPQATLAQRARDGVGVEADRSDRQKAHGVDTREHHQERKAKQRDRHNGKQRNRR